MQLFSLLQYIFTRLCITFLKSQTHQADTHISFLELQLQQHPQSVTRVALSHEKKWTVFVSFTNHGDTTKQHDTLGYIEIVVM